MNIFSLQKFYRFQFCLKILFLLLSYPVFSQTGKDTLVLKGLELTQKKEKAKFAPAKTIAIDSLTLAQYRTSSLAELISTQPSVFIREYGPGLSTPAFRGSSSGQTKVYWNEVPVGSSASGSLDFSLMPVMLFNKTEILYGNSSLLLGSGGLGGSILLENEILYGGNALSAGYTLGSFGTRQVYGGASYGSQKFSGHTMLYIRKALNDYEYHNIARFQAPPERQRNADGELWGGMQQLSWNISPKDKINGTLWYQTFSRNIAQPMTSLSGREWKNDSSTRAEIDYSHQFKKARWNTVAAATTESLHYRDLNTGLDSRTTVNKLFLKSRIRFSPFANAFMEFGINWTRDKAHSDGLLTPRLQERFSPYLELSQMIHRFQYQLLVREETVNGSLNPLAFNLAVMHQLISQKRLQVRLSGGRNFNYPALNDLYWVPGGNPSLRPETAYVFEGGLNSVLNLGNKFQFSPEVTAFTSSVTDQILWLPGIHTYWEAQNLKKVRSSGLETGFKLQHEGKLEYSFSLNYTFTQAISLSSLSSYDLSEGKQLIYVPEHNFRAAGQILYQSWSFGLEYFYTGSRFTNPDNSTSLPPFDLINLSLAKTININKLAVTFQLRIRNLLDKEYQVIEWYPMPGRYIEGSVFLNLKKLIISDEI